MYKITDKGFWVSKHYYWQSMLHYLVQSLRYRSFSYFSICNPKIHFGGMLNENKSETYNLIDTRYLPRTEVVKNAIDIQDFVDTQSDPYPFVLKPNIGFKGYEVHIVKDSDMLTQILDQLDFSKEWIAQEFISYTREFSILYLRKPNCKKGIISSFVEKKYPCVVADGCSSLEKLIDAYRNPYLNKTIIKKSLSADLLKVMAKGQRVVLHQIGNYSRGSKFLSLQHEIDDQLLKVLDNFYDNITGIDFFRIDCKADSIEHLKNGQFMIIELNGMKAEPIHIYDPKYSFWSNIKSIQSHWRYIDTLVQEKRKIMDFKLPTTAEGWQAKQHTKRLVP